MTEVAVQTLLSSRTVTVRDIRCRGSCRHATAEECAAATEIVFPYRGVYTRRVGREAVVAEANQALFFNADEGYRIDHPVAGGDACLSLAVDEAVLREMAPPPLVRRGAALAFHDQRRRIDPGAQALAARLRTRDLEPLEAETLALALIARAVGPWTSRSPGGTPGRRRLADRAKLVIAADPGRRWTLAEIAAEVGGSPVYLTQVFQAVEGVPLYRYQMRLRLARALDLLADAEDLTALGLDLGFSSHSHFTAAFRETYGVAPSAFRWAGPRRRLRAR